MDIVRTFLDFFDHFFAQRSDYFNDFHKAINRWQPILGSCAGSWQIWGVLGGNCRDVTDHAWRTMPSIKVDGDIGNNTQMHRVRIAPSTMLAGVVASCIRYQNRTPEQRSEGPMALIVNSVHWKAPDERTVS